MIIPTLRYNDCRKMIDWLCEAFGFTRHAVYEDDKGTIVHAQLVLGDSMIMLSTAKDDEFGKLQSHPMVLGGVTQSPYVMVADPDAIYKTAKAAGAKIVLEIKDEDYGGRAFSCLDPEQHLWNFGSYDPWKPATNDPAG